MHESSDRLTRTELKVLQVNVGNLCNQSCAHCHVGASPQGKNIMSRKVIDDILNFLSKNWGLTLDITGGAPELNPDFEYFVEKAHPLVKEIIVRSNLTVILEPGKEHLPEFYKKYGVHLICSLPCYTEGNVDAQRGYGVFKKSIEALKRLNQAGYSKGHGLPLDLVYNPGGAFLPPSPKKLEKDYKTRLRDEYGIDFNHLISITNVPIKRFKNFLKSRGEYEKYIDLLKTSFNPNVVDHLMCRTFLSVGYDGRLYDCDFNQVLGWALTDKEGNYLTIDKVSAKEFEGREILLGEHCFSCTAGCGSSCQGALADDQEAEPSDYCSGPTSGIRSGVREYYGKILSSKNDLKTSACCSSEVLPKVQREICGNIEPEILNKFYGCGSPIPQTIEGCAVLDLGCGTGRDVYIASKLVGPEGHIIGVDMTEEQLVIARKHLDKQMERFGFSKSNVTFKHGYIEELKGLGIGENSVDVVISNCVINLSPDKRSVFSGILRALKPGGELYFSDVFTGRRVPEHLQNDSVLRGECLGGAMYIEDFRRMLRDLGCLDFRVVSKRRISLDNEEIEARAGMIDFYSMTVRAFKLDLEDICEDYGQVAYYLGTIPDSPHEFILDDHHTFFTGKPMLVCGNTADMLSKTRFSRHFKIMGDKSVHLGPFPCGTVEKEEDSGGGCACC